MGTNIFFKVRGEFIYDTWIVGAIILVWNILKIPGELEVLEAGGEEGGVRPRIEVVVGHDWDRPLAG